MPSLDIEDAASLRRAYVDEGKSLAAIAELAGCSYATVRRALLAQQIEIRRSGPAPIEALRDRKWLQARVSEGSSAKDIAKLLGCAEATVRSALHSAGMTSGPPPARPSALDDVSFLQQAYVTDRRSVRSIAEELGCTKDAVLTALRSGGVPIRRRGRAPRAVSIAAVDTPEKRAAPEDDAQMWDAAVESSDADEPAAVPDPEPYRTPPEADAEVPPDDDPRPVVDEAVRRDAPAPPAEVPEAEPPEQAEVEAELSTVGVEGAGGATLAPAREPSPPATHARTTTTTYVPMQHENGASVTPSTPTSTETEDRAHRSWSERESVLPPGNMPPGRIDREIDKIEHMTFSVTLRGYDRQEVDGFLREIAKDYRQVVKSAREAVNAARAASQPPPAPPAPSAPSFQDVGGRVTAVLTSAAEAAEEIKASAEKEALAIRQAAREEAERLRRSAADALAEVDRIRAVKEQEAAEAEAASRAHAELIVAAAEQRAAQLEAEVQERVRLMDRTVRANLDARIAEARRDYEHLRSVQQQCIDRLASVEFLAKHARDGLSDNVGQSIDELL